MYVLIIGQFHKLKRQKCFPHTFNRNLHFPCLAWCNLIGENTKICFSHMKILFLPEIFIFPDHYWSIWLAGKNHFHMKKAYFVVSTNQIAPWRAGKIEIKKSTPRKAYFCLLANQIVQWWREGTSLRQYDIGHLSWIINRS